MDPKACLTNADQAISDGDLAEAGYLLEEYANWRARGGFRPVDVAGTTMAGDAFYGYCERRLLDVRQQQHITSGVADRETQHGRYIDSGPQAWDDTGREAFDEPM
jgi:hypothetical protein